MIIQKINHKERLDPKFLVQPVLDQVGTNNGINDITPTWNSSGKARLEKM